MPIIRTEMGKPVGASRKNTFFDGKMRVSEDNATPTLRRVKPTFAVEIRRWTTDTVHDRAHEKNPGSALARPGFFDDSSRQRRFVFRRRFLRANLQPVVVLFGTR